MSERWTKGPWQKRGFGLYLPGTQKSVAEVPTAWKTDAEALALLRLLAAAPAMLEALEEIVQRNEIQHWFNLDQARAALRLAREGE
jgi:hypothetical protein